ncbi:SDR family oxidoreductase [Mycolicibacterium goodii]|uniref:SDR family NAD(P)-dependent oxidoreductase n=1 Tax=Mycolicibacterium goodii TaxID=134601 RepID=UPI001BDC9082|nr:SDR family oxidoreductase [Mycolicibacterium goodii]MBU8809841.1 SDR family oxidoreductase [Mycolicibacterium goodii]
MSSTFDGRVALVTGGSRGIGAAIASRLADAGATVAVNYRSNAGVAQELVEALRSHGHRAEAFGGDLTDPAQIAGVIARIVEEFGALHLLASNAGVEHFAPLADITIDDFEKVFRTNVGGQLFAVQAAAAVMPAGSRIVLTSSVSARIAVHHHTLYAASKAAVSAMALNLAPELAEAGIAINAVAPGGTATDMAAENGADYVHPALAEVAPEKVTRSMNALGRLARPEEIADAVCFLLSQQASYITGSTLDVAGGWMR